jgi:plasmid stabilization system protein ParE
VNYFFSEAARAEHLEQVAYYEERRAGLGARYLAAFDVAMNQACAHPERYPVEHPAGIRRVRIPGFPFNVLYRAVRDGIEVLALAPHRRRPGYWLERV